MRRGDESIVKLKKYSVSPLQKGMMIGRGIYEDDMTVMTRTHGCIDQTVMKALAQQVLPFCDSLLTSMEMTH